MTIIEITALPNGAHRNQTCSGEVNLPEGWGVIPGELELENFPFGEVTAEEVDGVMTVTSWVPGVMPESEPAEEPAAGLTDAELAAALLDGINEI